MTEKNRHERKLNKNANNDKQYILFINNKMCDLFFVLFFVVVCLPILSIKLFKKI